MSFVDTHCHLAPTYLPDGEGAVLARAKAAGVEAFVVIGVDDNLAAAKHAVSLAENHAEIRAAVGIHPHDARVLDDAMFEELRALARHERVVAVGEIGLDYHYDHSPRDVQRAAFARLIGLARDLKKPIVIHTREAAEETLEILEAEGAREVGGIIHCFSEDVPFARRALDLDFDISFSGIVTFKSAVAIQEAARFVPSDRIHLETDSPYLAPVPLRGKTNEPAYLAHTAKRVAELRGTSLEDLAAVCRTNVERRLRTHFFETA